MQITEKFFFFLKNKENGFFFLKLKNSLFNDGIEKVALASLATFH